MPDFPTIRATVDALKPHLPEGFRIIVQYSGSDDSGWFDHEYFDDKDGKMICPAPAAANAILEEFSKEIYNELYPLLYGKFPGWEIGDGHVRGSHGHFTINSATNTITHNHYIDYNEEEDVSPDEEIKF